MVTWPFKFIRWMFGEAPEPRGLIIMDVPPPRPSAAAGTKLPADYEG